MNGGRVRVVATAEEFIRTRVTPEEKQRIEAGASAANVTLSEYARARLLDGVDRQTDEELRIIADVVLLNTVLDTVAGRDWKAIQAAMENYEHEGAERAAGIRARRLVKLKNARALRVAAAASAKKAEEVSNQRR